MNKIEQIIYYTFSKSREKNDIAYWKKELDKNNFPIFNQILIETRTDCNRKCSFCPQSITERNLQVMDEGLFKKIIDELADLDWSGRIALMVTNEPLLDDRLVDFIKYTRRKSGKFYIDVNTNGNLLNVNKLDELFKAGLDSINIDDYRRDRDKYPTKLSKNIQKIEDNFVNNPKVNIFYRHYFEDLSNRGGSMDSGPVDNPQKHTFCSDPFVRMVISPSGDVVLCCMDYFYKEKFGNVNKQSMQEIWNSKRFKDVRTSLVNKDRKGLCAQCDKNPYQSLPRRIKRKSGHVIKRLKHLIKVK